MTGSGSDEPAEGTARETVADSENGVGDSLVDILTDDWGLAIRLALAGGVVVLFYYVAATILALPFLSSAGSAVAFLGGIGLSVVLMALMYYRGLRSMTRGEDIHDLPRSRAPAIHDRAEEMADDLGIAKPTLLVKASEAPNAYAIGRAGNGYVVFHQGLLDELDDEEVAAVLGHEMAHLKHRDSVVQTLATTTQSVIRWAVLLMVAFYAFVFSMLRYSNYAFIDSLRLAFRDITRGTSGKVVGAIVAVVGVFMLLFTRALSRYREYLADRRAATLVGSHEPMADALRTLSTAPPQEEGTTNDVPLSLCIHGEVNSLLGRLLADHPPIESRIERLQRAFDAA